MEEKPAEKVFENRDNSFIDIVYLKDGTIVKGTIIETIPNVQIKIKTLDSTIRLISRSEIDKIVKESVK